MREEKTEEPRERTSGGGGQSGGAVASVVQSGIPFQLAVERKVEAVQKAANGPSAFAVGREVPWALEGGERKSGYVDLAIEVNAKAYCVVECKRYGGEELAFVRLAGATPPGAFAMLKTQVAPDRITCEAVFFPPTDELAAEFCVFKDAKPRTFEALASEVNLATEALGRHLLHSVEHQRLLLPVVVVNLPLCICEFAPEDVPLDTGRIDGSKVKKRVVPFVRFQKAIASTARLPENLPSPWRAAIGSDRFALRGRRGEIFDKVSRDERTVWVVTAQRIGEFLSAVQEMGFRM